jgi:hypothetical protein
MLAGGAAAGERRHDDSGGAQDCAEGDLFEQ